MDDLIERQAAIDAIADYLSKITYTSAISHLNTGALILARVPSAQPEQRWIPCNERLPHTNGLYNVTRKISDGFECGNISDTCYYDGATWHDDTRINHERRYLTDVVAWTSLPEPWKGEKHETD